MEPSAPRRLGPFDATMLVMGAILGVGIFFNPAQVAALVPNEAAFLAAWALGGAIAVCGAFTFAELGATFPHAGGWFVYMREIYGARVAFLFAWVVLFVISTGALAVMAGFCTSMLSGVLPFLGEDGGLQRRVASAGLLLVITGLALGGVRVGATFQNACMLLKLGAIAALVVAGFLLVTPAGGAAEALPPALEAAAAPRPTLWRGLVLAMLPVLFSCGGWQMLGYAASETRDPQRVLPRAILLGVSGVIVVYLLLNLDYLRVLGFEALSGDFGFAAEVARRSFGSRGGEVLKVAMAVSAIGVCTVTTLVTPWIYVAMAREGSFFRSFGELSPRTGAPVLALCLQCALAVTYVFAGDADFLVGSVVFVEWIFHALVAWGLIRLRRTRPELPRPFRSFAYPLLPTLYLLAAVLVVGGNLWQADGVTTGTGLAVVALGLVVHPLWRRYFERRARGPA